MSRDNAGRNNPSDALNVIRVVGSKSAASDDAQATASTAGDAKAPESDDGRPREFGGPKGPEPTRFGDWERKGRCVDF